MFGSALKKIEKKPKTIGGLKMVDLEKMTEREREDYDRVYGRGVHDAREAGPLDHLGNAAGGFGAILNILGKSTQELGYEQGQKDYSQGKTQTR